MPFSKVTLIKIIFFIVCGFFLISALINWVVDAGGVYGSVEIEGFNKYKFKRTQANVLLNGTKKLDQFDTLIFGTSRSAIYGSNNDAFSQLKILNLSDIVYGYPSRIYDFIDKGMKTNNSIKRIIVGLDLHTMITPRARLEDMRNHLYYNHPDIAHALSLLYKLLPNSLPLTFLTVKNNWKGKRPLSHMDEFGVRHYNANKHQYITNVDKKTKPFSYDESELDYLKKIVQICKDKNIELSFFTFPYSVDFYQIDYSKEEVKKFLDIVGGYVDGVYNFSYKNTLTDNPENYFNLRHHNHNFDTFIYAALIKKNKMGMIDNKLVFKYLNQ